MNKDWAINEDILTDQEAERQFAHKLEPSIEKGLSLFSKAAALDECALELTVQDTKIHGEAESIRKAGLEMMAAATQPAPSTSTSTAPLEVEGSSSNPIAVESSPPSSPATPNIGPLQKCHHTSPVQITVEPGLDILSVHPVKAFPQVWCTTLAPKNIGISGNQFYCCSASDCLFQAKHIGPVWAHIATDHTGMEALCALCQRAFTNPYSMQDHLNNHHSKKKGKN